MSGPSVKRLLNESKMKTLEPLQYDWLCAIAKKDYVVIVAIGEMFHDGEATLFKRGLYTAEPHPTEPNKYIVASFQLTTAGRDAIMCYRALMNEFSFT